MIVQNWQSKDIRRKGYEDVYYLNNHLNGVEGAFVKIEFQPYQCFINFKTGDVFEFFQIDKTRLPDLVISADEKQIAELMFGKGAVSIQYKP